MTTLPQTTGTRFPRAGGRAPNIPGPAQSGLAVQGAGNTLSVSDVIRVLRANALLTLVLFVLSLGVGYGVYWLLARYNPVYTATARLQVQTPTLIDYNSNSGFASRGESVPLEIRIETQNKKLQHTTLWEKMLRNTESPIFKQTEWASDFKSKDATGNEVFDVVAAINDLRKRLTVIPYKNSEIIDVSIATKKKEDAKVILEELIRNHVENEQTASSQSQTDERAYLQARKTSFESKLSSLKNVAGNLQQSLGFTSNTNSRGRGDGLSIELGRLVNERITAQSEAAEAKSAFDNVKAAVDAGEIPPMAQRNIDNDPTLARLRADVDQIDTMMAATIAEKGEKYPTIKTMQSQLTVLKKKADDRESEVRNREINLVLQTAKSMAESADATLAAIDKQLETVKADLTEFNRNSNQYATNQEQVKYYDLQLQKLNERIEMIDTNKVRDDDARSTIRRIGIEEPRGMTSPNLSVVMALSGVIGLGLALGIAFLRELMDTSIRSPRDITRVGQMNLLGMIPHEDDDPQAAGSELSLVISQAPHSVIAEQFRQVRTRLQHASSLDTTRSLLVTSPGPGDGKTTVACNLAAGLALNGRKILLVDSNFRRPQIHSVFGLANDVGFGSVLSQQASVETAVRKTNVPNLDVLTTGPRPANPTELLESALLTEFIDRALEEYDHVVFDSGPILLVSETVALAPRVDGVITVVKARANSRGLLQRMRDALRQLKAEHIGVVLNGVKTQGGGYYGRNIKTYYTYQSAGN